ncbi:MAG TPA: leucyl aminopeptidase [Cytophagaceae bacterium]|nr:leucyl aminopeptidase [Cytophagaceae bacterium]
MSFLQITPPDLLDLSQPLLYLSPSDSLGHTGFLTEEETSFINQQLKNGLAVAELNTPEKIVFVISLVKSSTEADRIEKYRRAGATLSAKLIALKFKEATLYATQQPGELLALAEGLVLASYRFSKYKKGSEPSLKKINIAAETDLTEQVDELNLLLEAVYKTRNLVNEPVVFLTAEQLSIEITNLGKDAGFSTEVFNKSKIQSLKMGGLLAVNIGSPNPPTFNVLEYKPQNAVNTKPYILVGKGVVYDTGGLSLKPTEHSMDMMKCDMAGAAAVAGAFYAIAKNKLPIYLIGLIPATENRPDGNAITPGDIITMHNGKTVEVLNTDAEGRLILADALSYASKYDPELVIDLATLTGAAVRAIGKEGIVYMGTADEQTKQTLETTGMNVFERLVEFPLWEDYDQHIQSDIADLKNIGTGEAGAISAGKFMEHFTSYPWLHLDIAGGAFMVGPFHYWVKGGTGLGVRLLYHFLKNKINK